MSAKANAYPAWQRPGYVKLRIGPDENLPAAELTPREARRLAVKLLDAADAAERRFRQRTKWAGRRLVAVPS